MLMVATSRTLPVGAILVLRIRIAATFQTLGATVAAHPTAKGTVRAMRARMVYLHGVTAAAKGVEVGIVASITCPAALTKSRPNQKFCSGIGFGHICFSVHGLDVARYCYWRISGRFARRQAAFDAGNFMIRVAGVEERDRVALAA